MLFISELTNSTNVLRSLKTKRFAKMDDCYDESENGETMQNDIHIIPEGRLEDFAARANRHANHRYFELGSEGDNYKKAAKDLPGESSWSWNPSKAKKPEHKNTRSQISNLRKTGDPLRFKAVFGHVSPEDDLANSPSTENYYYSKEINDLMQNHSSNEREEKGAFKKVYKSHGAPFRVPVKDVSARERLNLYRPSPSEQKQSWFKQQLRKKPLTILVDIYPLAEADEYFKKDGTKLRRVIKPLRNEFSKPRDVFSEGKFLLPRERKNGIIMKLNLYLKERKFSRHQNSMEEAEDEIHLRERKRAEEKSFGWFSAKKEKKQEPKQCSLMALKPQGKHVTAKWKNKNGDWIHAKHLLVKYLKT